MAKIRDHLARAPITEALIDLQVRPSSETGLDHVRRVAQALKERYEPQAPIFELQTQWSLPAQGSPQNHSAARELGIRLQSADGRYIVQARSGGISLSRLEPYEDWDTLLAETQSLWETYAKVVQVEAVTRVATRFINNLRLPLKPGEVFETYLTSPPQVPNDLPQGVLGFLQRVVVTKPELDIRANVIQLLQEGIAPVNHIPVILDIDVYKQVVIPPESDDIWSLLAELRVFKNAIFFASLTEPAVELFE